MSTALEVNGLTKHFSTGGTRLFAGKRKVHAVDDVTFSLRPGTITGLVGESGSGKSTVARVLARLHDPTAGSVVFEGQDATRSDILRYRSQVQMIFQDPFGSLNPVKTVAHHIERPLLIHKIVPRKQVGERVHELLKTVGLVPPEHIARKYPHELSGGQRQRVAIARALVNDPSILLADEPTGNLDSVTSEEIMRVFADLHAAGQTVIMVTHEPDIAAHAERVVVLRDGRVESDRLTRGAAA